MFFLIIITFIKHLKLQNINLFILKLKKILNSNEVNNDMKLFF